MTRIIPLLLLVALAASVPAVQSTSPYVLYLDSDEDGTICDVGILNESVPTGSYGCQIAPSTVGALGRTIQHAFLQKVAPGAPVALGDEATLRLYLYHALVPGVPHPLARVNATLDVVDGATATRIGSGEAPCETLVEITWSCDVSMDLAGADLPAGARLLLTVTWVQDEHVVSPGILFGSGWSRIEFPDAAA